jgi:hypothetical protein
MKKYSDAQKWVAYYLSNGWELWRIVDYCYVSKHPNQYRVSVATLRAMFDAGLIELEYEKDSNERAFCLTQRGADLFKAGVLCPKSQLPKNQVSLPA